MKSLLFILSAFVISNTRAQTLKFEKIIKQYNSKGDLEEVVIETSLKIEHKIKCVIPRSEIENYKINKYLSLDVNNSNPFYFVEKVIIYNNNDTLNAFKFTTNLGRNYYRKLVLKKGTIVLFKTIAYKKSNLNFEQQIKNNFFGDKIVDDKLLKLVIIKIYPIINNGLSPIEYIVDLK